jgi:hypothetical protein
MKIEHQKAVQTYRLVDEKREVAVRGALSLLLPGPTGGHLLLGMPDGARETAPGAIALGVTVSRGPAGRWRLVTAAGPGHAPLPRRVFCFAFVVHGRSMVFYDEAGDDGDEVAIS